MIQLPASYLSSKTSFNSRLSGTAIREGLDVLDVVKMSTEGHAVGIQQHFGAHPFIGEGVIWSSLLGSPAGDEAMGLSTLPLPSYLCDFYCILLADAFICRVCFFCIGKIALNHAVF